VHILASHPSERLLWILMEVDGAKELTDCQRLNRLLKSDKVKDIQLEKSLMDEAELSRDILLEVLGVKGFGSHIQPTLHVLLSIIVVIPHGSLKFGPELLVTTSVPPHMEAVRVLLLKAMPSVDMRRAQIFCDLLLHINRNKVDALSPLGRVYPMRMNNLCLQRLPCSSRTATTHSTLPCMMGTGTTRRSSPKHINLRLLDLKHCGFFRIINVEVSVLDRVLRV
jgi:hypothetical protein